MSAALEDVDAVIHSAGLEHAMSGVPEDDYRLLNTEATISLARAARRAGAKRFVFRSLLAVENLLDHPFIGRADSIFAVAPFELCTTSFS
jgi:nucleoside-diphosphate-sugar epimerase